MNRLFLALLLFVACVPASAQNPLRQAASQGATSIAWRIQTEGVYICCCGTNNQIINHGDGASQIEYDTINLIARLDDDGKVTKVKMTEPSCPPPAGTRVIENVTPDASIDFLLEHAQVAPLAMHDHPRVVPELIQLARNDRRTEVRRNAIFWLGQRAGEKAAGELRRAVDEDPEDKVREHAVFAISQLPADRSVPILIDLVKTHKRPKVRQRAMFWLAQTNDPRALELIEEILGVR